jgi:hypothetical protein
MIKKMKQMKKIGILLLLVLANGVLVDAQETYRFTIDPLTLKKDTIKVYDERDDVVLMHGKNIFVYRQTPIKVTKDKGERVFSSPDGELGRVSSKYYKKIHLADGSTYIFATSRKNKSSYKVSFKKDDNVCAYLEYSFRSGYPSSMWDKVDVEMGVDTDTDFIPFLFQCALLQIRVTRMVEQSIWQSAFSLL